MYFLEAIAIGFYKKEIMLSKIFINMRSVSKLVKYKLKSNRDYVGTCRSHFYLERGST